MEPRSRLRKTLLTIFDIACDMGVWVWRCVGLMAWYGAVDVDLSSLRQIIHPADGDHAPQWGNVDHVDFGCGESHTISLGVAAGLRVDGAVMGR